MVTWSYGVTTVPSRFQSHFLTTLRSLSDAGFSEPFIFVDNCNDPTNYFKLGNPVVVHSTGATPYGNWLIGLLRLYLADPKADRYAIFQDDFVTYRNLRDYLSWLDMPEDYYWNLYTFPENYLIKPKTLTTGWFLSNQLGFGAVGLVFTRSQVISLLTSNHVISRIKDRPRGEKGIDGAVVQAFKSLNIREQVHHPSLVQHTGLVSSIGNKRHDLAPAFWGEPFDARNWIRDNSLESV